MREGERQRPPAWEFRGIQALRAVAAFAVVLGHSMNYLQHGHGTVPQLLGEFQGAIGVDLFFVISGFVMTVSSGRLLAHAHPARVFLWRRLLRVAPLYWLSTAVKLVALAALPRFEEAARPSLWNITSSFLFIPSVNGLGEIRPVITIGWTLNFEMMFYLLFAISLLWRRRFVSVLLPLVLLLAAAGGLRSGTWPAWTAGADPIVLEFAAGVVIALLLKRGWLPGPLGSVLALAVGWVGLLLIGPSIAVHLRGVIWGVPAALVVLGVVGLEPVLRDRLPRWLLLLGSASYAVYLMQTFVFPVVDLFAERLRGTGGLTQLELGAVVVAGSLAASAAIGVTVHLTVERPLTEMLKRRFGVDRIAPIARQG